MVRLMSGKPDAEERLRRFPDAIPDYYNTRLEHDYVDPEHRALIDSYTRQRIDQVAAPATTIASSAQSAISNTVQTTQKVALAYPEIESILMKALNTEYPMTVRLSLIFVVFVLLLVSFAFGQEVAQYFKKQASATTSEVANSVLGDKDTQRSTTEFSKAVIGQILEDEETRKRLMVFLDQTLTSEETASILQGVVAGVLQSEATRKELYDLIMDPYTQRVLLDLVLWLFAQESTTKDLSKLVVSLLADEWFREQGHDLLVSVLVGVVQDPKVIQATLKAVKGMVGDESLQQSTGSALWSAVATPFLPSTWMKRQGTQSKPEPSSSTHDKAVVAVEAGGGPKQIAVPAAAQITISSESGAQQKPADGIPDQTAAGEIPSSVPAIKTAQIQAQDSPLPSIAGPTTSPSSGATSTERVLPVSPAGRTLLAISQTGASKLQDHKPAKAVASTTTSRADGGLHAVRAVPVTVPVPVPVPMSAQRSASAGPSASREQREQPGHVNVHPPLHRQHVTALRPGESPSIVLKGQVGPEAIRSSAQRPARSEIAGAKGTGSGDATAAAAASKARMGSTGDMDVSSVRIDTRPSGSASPSKLDSKSGSGSSSREVSDSGRIQRKAGRADAVEATTVAKHAAVKHHAKPSTQAPHASREGSKVQNISKTDSVVVPATIAGAASAQSVSNARVSLPREAAAPIHEHHTHRVDSDHAQQAASGTLPSRTIGSPSPGTASQVAGNKKFDSGSPPQAAVLQVKILPVEAGAHSTADSEAIAKHVAVSSVAIDASSSMSEEIADGSAEDDLPSEFVLDIEAKETAGTQGTEAAGDSKSTIEGAHQ